MGQVFLGHISTLIDFSSVGNCVTWGDQAFISEDNHLLCSTLISQETDNFWRRKGKCGWELWLTWETLYNQLIPWEAHFN